jgi:hypothetical protein
MTMRRLVAAILMGLAAAVTAMPQDPLAVSPKDYKLELENEWVRVLRLKQEPHERVAVHEEPAVVVVYLTPARQRFTGADGKVREISKKAGEVVYLDAGKRAEENASDAPLEAVVVELKSGAPKSKEPPVTLDPAKLDPENVTVAFENAPVRVLHTVLVPHRQDPMHEHPHYVVVYLTQLHTTMRIADGRVVDNVRHPGEVAWREAMKHATENVDDQPAAEIQVELK